MFNSSKNRESVKIMSRLTSDIEVEKAIILLEIENGTRFPCFVKNNGKKTPLSIEFFSAAENSDDPFTPANKIEETAVRGLADDDELFKSPLSAQHFDKTYWMLTPPMQ